MEDRKPLSTPKVLGIDKFAVRKGYRYATILCDLDQREVLEVCLGHRLKEVIGLLSRLAAPTGLAGSMDMSASFAPAVCKTLSHAQMAIDHFHVIQHIMKAFRKVVSE